MTVVTDSLKYYYHYASNCSASGWGNIAPSGTVPIGVMNNVTFTNGVPTFNGTNSTVDFTGINLQSPTSAFTVEIIFERNTSNLAETVCLSGYYGSSERFHLMSSGEFMGSASLEAYINRSGALSLRRDDVKNKGERVHLTLVYSPMTGAKKFFRDGSLISSSTTSTLPFTRPNYNMYLGCLYNGSKSSFHNGKIYTVRVYNKALTDEEVFSNYTNALDIGISAPVPIATVVSASKPKISRQNGAEKTYVTFKFDKDITSYVVRVGGSDYQTGFLADSGGAITANTEIVAEIDHTELSSEGINRINVYGQGSGGWSTQN